MVRKIELFTANCKLCEVTVGAVRTAARADDRIMIYRPEMCVAGECCRKADGYGVYAVPAIVVNKKLVHTGKLDAERAKALLR